MTSHSGCGSRAPAHLSRCRPGRPYSTPFVRRGIESGTCGTCRTKLIAGEADHRDLVLADNERADNIMICVSRARSSDLVIDM